MVVLGPMRLFILVVCSCFLFMKSTRIDHIGIEKGGGSSRVLNFRIVPTLTGKNF